MAFSFFAWIGVVWGEKKKSELKGWNEKRVAHTRQHTHTYINTRDGRMFHKGRLLCEASNTMHADCTSERPAAVRVVLLVLLLLLRK